MYGTVGKDRVGSCFVLSCSRIAGVLPDWIWMKFSPPMSDRRTPCSFSQMDCVSTLHVELEILAIRLQFSFHNGFAYPQGKNAVFALFLITFSFVSWCPDFSLRVFAHLCA